MENQQTQLLSSQSEKDPSDQNAKRIEKELIEINRFRIEDQKQNLDLFEGMRAHKSPVLHTF